MLRSVIPNVPASEMEFLDWNAGSLAPEVISHVPRSGSRHMNSDDIGETRKPLAANKRIFTASNDKKPFGGHAGGVQPGLKSSLWHFSVGNPLDLKAFLWIDRYPVIPTSTYKFINLFDYIVLCFDDGALNAN